LKRLLFKVPSNFQWQFCQDQKEWFFKTSGSETKEKIERKIFFYFPKLKLHNEKINISSFYVLFKTENLVKVIKMNTFGRFHYYVLMSGLLFGSLFTTRV
jgi:hypothetical protein